MLSNKTKYAIKALLAIYHNEQKENFLPLQVSSIAEQQNIPQKFLELIVLDLKKIGAIESKRGKGGGYFLIKPAKDITIGDVIRFFEGQIALLPCVSQNRYRPCEDCKSEDECNLRILMQKVRDKTAKILDETSLYCFANNHHSNLV